MSGHVAVGEGISPETLLDEYDAILLSCGLGQSKGLDLPGVELKGVMTAVDMLLLHNRMSQAKSDALPTRGARVVVIGGGNTAMDAACVARQAGADVTVLYRRSMAEMTAWQTEYNAAGALGVGFRWWTAPVAIIGDDHVLGVRIVTMQPSVEGDPGGKLEMLPNSEHEILADFVIIAIGQGINPVVKMLAGQRKVFLAGDVLNGGATVVQAVAEGHQAALAIDKFLRPDSAETEGERLA